VDLNASNCQRLDLSLKKKSFVKDSTSKAVRATARKVFGNSQKDSGREAEKGESPNLLKGESPSFAQSSKTGLAFDCQARKV